MGAGVELAAEDLGVAGLGPRRELVGGDPVVVAPQARAVGDRPPVLVLADDDAQPGAGVDCHGDQVVRGFIGHHNRVVALDVRHELGVLRRIVHQKRPRTTWRGQGPVVGILVLSVQQHRRPDRNVEQTGGDLPRDRGVDVAFAVIGARGGRDLDLEDRGPAFF